jgi:hypothetical protein
MADDTPKIAVKPPKPWKTRQPTPSKPDQVFILIDASFTPLDILKIKDERKGPAPAGPFAFNPQNLTGAHP